MILQLVTDRRRLVGSAHASATAQTACLLEQARHAVAAGVDIIQVRERDLEARPLADLVSAILEVTRGSATRVVVNDRVDVALATGAAGVHLRADSFDARDVRSLAPRPFLVGRSVHTVADAEGAGPVDYLIAGTVWPTVSKAADCPLLGRDGLAAIARAAAVPVLAIGGITPDRLSDVAAAGAAGVAAIGLFMADGEGCRARELHDLAQKFRATLGAVNMEPHSRKR
jgi:thiamine-phosphate diphosphorylase